jgi:hypothetical protein
MELIHIHYANATFPFEINNLSLENLALKNKKLSGFLKSSTMSSRHHAISRRYLCRYPRVIALSCERSGRFANQAGGASRDRTDDPLLAKQVLSQLSYGP